MISSREKGKRGERAWRDELRARGFDARRGQQFSGSPDSPDVVCDRLRWIHFEVKRVERLNIYEAMEQARRDCSTSPLPSPQSGEGEGCQACKVPIVAHKRNRGPWLVTMDAETLFEFLDGTLPGTCVPASAAPGEDGTGRDRNSES